MDCFFIDNCHSFWVPLLTQDDTSLWYQREIDVYFLAVYVLQWLLRCLPIWVQCLQWQCRIQRWGPYMQSCLIVWGFNTEKLKLPQIPNPMVHYGKTAFTYISTLEGPGSISCGQYLDRTLGQISPILWTPPFITRYLSMSFTDWMKRNMQNTHECTIKFSTVCFRGYWPNNWHWPAETRFAIGSQCENMISSGT